MTIRRSAQDVGVFTKVDLNPKETTKPTGARSCSAPIGALLINVGEIRRFPMTSRQFIKCKGRRLDDNKVRQSQKKFQSRRVPEVVRHPSEPY